MIGSGVTRRIDADFNDSTWPAAREIAPFGAPPWGRLSAGQLTLSPVKADPFSGHCDVPAGPEWKTSRVCLELDELAPETAARITINDEFVGGFIDKPFRLDVTRHLKPGRNTVRIEPFAPRAARRAFFP